MSNPTQSRIEDELAGTKITDESRIEQYIAYIKGDVETKPSKPRSRIEAQLDSLELGGSVTAGVVSIVAVGTSESAQGKITQ